MKFSSDYTTYKSFQEKLNSIYLCRKGGIMSGNIYMNCNNIYNLNELAFCNNGKITIPGTIITNDISVNNTIYHSGSFSPAIGIQNLAQVLIIGNKASTNIDMSKNLLIDVSGIRFSDGTYVGEGSSFDISTNKVLHIQSYNNNIRMDASAISIGGILNPTEMLDISGNIKLNKDIVFSLNNKQNVMTFSDFSSNNQNVDLPSINNQPISLMRTTILYNSNVNQTLLGGTTQNIILDISNSLIENQLQLSISGDIISPSLDISGQYVEMYANIEIQPSSNKTEISFDISGVDCGFLEIIDTKYVERQNTYYITFGPHIFIPSQWANCSQFVFKLQNHTNNAVTINKFKIVFKSNYI